MSLGNLSRMSSETSFHVEVDKEVVDFRTVAAVDLTEIATKVNASSTLKV